VKRADHELIVGSEYEGLRVLQQTFAIGVSEEEVLERFGAFIESAESHRARNPNVIPRVGFNRYRLSRDNAAWLVWVGSECRESLAIVAYQIVVRRYPYKSSLVLKNILHPGGG